MKPATVTFTYNPEANQDGGGLEDYIDLPVYKVIAAFEDIEFDGSDKTAFEWKFTDSDGHAWYIYDYKDLDFYYGGNDGITEQEFRNSVFHFHIGSNCPDKKETLEAFKAYLLEETGKIPDRYEEDRSVILVVRASITALKPDIANGDFDVKLNDTDTVIINTVDDVVLKEA